MCRHMVGGKDTFKELRQAADKQRERRSDRMMREEGHQRVGQNDQEAPSTAQSINMFDLPLPVVL